MCAIVPEWTSLYMSDKVLCACMCICGCICKQCNCPCAYMSKVSLGIERRTGKWQDGGGSHCNFCWVLKIFKYENHCLDQMLWLMAFGLFFQFLLNGLPHIQMLACDFLFCFAAHRT